MTFVSPAISLAIDTLAAYNKPVVDRLKEVQVMCKPSVISGWGRPSAAKVQVVESLRELVACLLGQLETYRIMTARDKESLKLEKEMSLTSLALGGGPMTLDQLTPGGFAFPAGLMPHGGGSTQFGSQAWDTNHFAAGGGGGSFSSAGASGYGRGGSSRGRNPFPSNRGRGRGGLGRGGLGSFPNTGMRGPREQARMLCMQKGLPEGVCFSCGVLDKPTPRDQFGRAAHRFDDCPNLSQALMALSGGGTAGTPPLVNPTPTGAVGSTVAGAQ